MEPDQYCLYVSVGTNWSIMVVQPFPGHVQIKHRIVGEEEVIERVQLTGAMSPELKVSRIMARVEVLQGMYRNASRAAGIQDTQAE